LYPDCEWRSWNKPIAAQNSDCSGIVVQVNKNNTECVACGLKEKVAEAEPA